MKGKLLLVIAVATAYIMGARAGRERYEQIMSSVKQAVGDPKVRQAATQASEAVKQKAQSVRGASQPADSDG
jgi:uncharacterized protein (UPF0147 family)